MSGPIVEISAPGRVNLIGEHTDYQDGFVLPVAIDRATTVRLEAREDGRVRLESPGFGGVVEFASLPDRPPVQGQWTNYPLGVAWALRGAGHAVGGFDARYSSDVPAGAGLSSSAAIEVATAAALRKAFALRIDDLDLVKACRKAEREFAGVPCGIMDQFISALGRKDHALLLDCRSLEAETVPLDALGGGSLILFDSGVRHRLGDSEYGARQRECAEAVERIAARKPAVKALRDLSEEGLGSILATLPETLMRRVRHVVTENTRVLRFRDALEAEDPAWAGRLMNESHDSLRDDFQVSCPELDLLASAAQASEAAYGARMVGGGFGGCVLALAKPGREEELVRHVARACDPGPLRGQPVHRFGTADGALRSVDG